MSDREKKEQEILNQEMSSDEMETVAGGECIIGAFQECIADVFLQYGRPILRPDGSVNCASTVEDGSHCETTDACYRSQVVYLGLKDCDKAWK